MDPKYKIIWTNVAEKDLRNIIEYISVDSPHNALKILKKIQQVALSLYTLPERGRIVMNGHAAFFVKRVFHQGHKRPGKRFQRGVIAGRVLKYGCR